MIRTLLGVVVLLALPALLTAQTPVTPKAVPAKPALTHGIATQVQGEVVRTEEKEGVDKPKEKEGVDKSKEKEGVDHDLNNDQVGDQQEGVDKPNGQNNQEGVDHDLNNDQVGDQAGEDQGSTAAPPEGVEQNSRIGRHKP